MELDLRDIELAGRGEPQERLERIRGGRCEHHTIVFRRRLGKRIRANRKTSKSVARPRQVHERHPVSAVLAELNFSVRYHWLTKRAPGSRSDGERLCPERQCEFELNPGRLTIFRKWQCDILTDVAIHQGCCVERTRTRGHRWMQVPHPHLSIRHAIGDYREISVVRGIGRQWWQFRLRLRAGEVRRCRECEIRRNRNVLETTIHRRRIRQRARELPGALHLRFAPDGLLHGLIGLHPGSCGLTPAARGGHGHLQAQTISLSTCVAKRVLPVRSHPDQPLVHKLRYA